MLSPCAGGAEPTEAEPADVTRHVEEPGQPRALASRIRPLPPTPLLSRIFT